MTATSIAFDVPAGRESELVEKVQAAMAKAGFSDDVPQERAAECEAIFRRVAFEMGLPTESTQSSLN